MVTRTFASTKVKALVVENETGNVSTVERTLPKEYTSNEQILKALEKHLPIEGSKYFHVSEITKELKRYGMDEADFIAHARELPLLTKPEDAESEIDN